MVIAIIQARINSERLKGKVLMSYCGKTNLQHIVDRLRRSKEIDKIIVATSESVDDGKIYDYCIKNNIECFRGSKVDVLDRYYKTSLHKKLIYSDIVVRVTGDCPLIDYQLTDKIIKFYKLNDYDYVSNTIVPTFPDGLDIEVFSFRILEKAWKEAGLYSEREHVTPYIKKNKSLFKLGNYKGSPDLSSYRWTLDEKEDYEFINTIYENLYYKNNYFKMDDILKFLDNNKALLEINRKFKRNEGYEKSLSKDSIIF